MKDQKSVRIYKNNLIDFDSNVYFNNITAGSNNINLRKVNVKAYRSDKMYMHKDLLEDKF